MEYRNDIWQVAQAIPNALLLVAFQFIGDRRIAAEPVHAVRPAAQQAPQSGRRLSAVSIMAAAGILVACKFWRSW